MPMTRLPDAVRAHAGALVRTVLGAVILGVWR